METLADLHSHVDLCGLVNDFANGTIVAFSELVLEFKLIHADAKRGTAGEIYALGMENGLAIEIEGARWITGSKKKAPNAR